MARQQSVSVSGREIPILSMVDEVVNVHESDKADMARFGKRQQLKRNFGLTSIIGLTCTLMITWEGMLTVFEKGLRNGGPSGLIYGYVFTWTGNFLQILVMAEMGSMVPLSGGQYNWVAVLAPPDYARFLSYLTGWTTLIAWQAVAASAALLSGSMIQSLIVLAMGGTYKPENWQLLIFMYCVLVVTIFVNTVLARALPQIESIVFMIHVIGFCVIMIVLIYLTPNKASASEVFSNFSNGGGFSSMTISVLVGAGGAQFSFTGVDAASHVAEEIENAATVIPRSMICSVLLNGALGLGMTIAILFCIGNVNRMVNSNPGYPFMEIFYNVTGSKAGAVAMTSLIISAMTLSAIGCFVSASRVTWAFARERGIPLAKHISKVNKRTKLPLYSIGLTAAVTAALALLVLQSPDTLNAVVSLVVAGFYSTFIISSSVMLYKRLTTPPDQIRWGTFRLYWTGIPITILALIYSIIGMFFSFWPPVADVTLASMNWNCLVFGVTLIFSMVFWFLHGRKTYDGPIVEVEIEELDLDDSKTPPVAASDAASQV